MDIFKIEPGSSISANITNIIDDTCDRLPEVNFDAGSEFNLRFFNTPDDSNTQGGFSDAGSVDELSIRSPSPPSINNDSNNCGGNLIEQFVGGDIGQFHIVQPPVLVNIKSGEFFSDDWISICSDEDYIFSAFVYVMTYGLCNLLHKAQ